MNNKESTNINQQNSIDQIKSDIKIIPQNENKKKKDKILLKINKKKSSIQGMKVLSSNKIKKISEPKSNLNKMVIAQIKNNTNNKIIKIKS